MLAPRPAARSRSIGSRCRTRAEHRPTRQPAETRLRRDTLDCVEIDVINELDGFHVQPRESIPFNGPIDPASVNKQTVFFVALGDAANEALPSDARNGVGKIVGVNRVMWDVDTQTLQATADEILDQHSRYALVVTCGITDLAEIRSTPLQRSNGSVTI